LELPAHYTVAEVIERLEVMHGEVWARGISELGDVLGNHHLWDKYWSQITALRKLPLDSKVRLTVEEINELFNNGEEND